jgi:cystathionine beta-lyase/cystathionine gamma-synthase
MQMLVGMVSLKNCGGDGSTMTFTNAATNAAVSLGNVASLIQHQASMTLSATQK